MRKLIAVLFLFCGAIVYGQVVPQGINYQAVALDQQGQPIPGVDIVGRPIDDAEIGVRISILEASPTGNVLYQEEHEVLTDQYGMFNLTIGQGLQVSADPFNTINWQGDKFLQVELSIENDGEFTLSAVQQLMSVPYAFLADRALNVDDADSDPTNELQALSISNDTLYLSSGGFVVLPSDQINDADADPTNEYNIGATLNGTMLSITDGGGTQNVQLGGLNSDNQNLWANLSGTTLTVNIQNGNPAIIDLAPIQDGVIPSGTNFADLTNWDSNWRAEALRPFGDFLLGLNMTESSTNYANRVRFSNLVTANAIPDSWDASAADKSAGFNDLVSMQTSIVDGLELGTNFVIYSSTEAVMMEFVGGQLIFNFRKLFSDEGIINQNCVVEVDGKHYCFGVSDVYVHDGNTKQSICDERVRQFIYKGLNVKNADRCFVQHNKELSEIYFCYQSGDSLVSFADTSRCNRAAIFNVKNNTWSFMDLPNVSAGTSANVNTVSTYSASTSTYDTIGGSYYDQEDSRNRHTLMVGNSDSGNSLSSAKIYGLDLADDGSIAFNVDTEATKPPFVERTGLDLDEINQPIDGYKVITRMLPQIFTKNTSNTNITIEFGASDIPNNTPAYTTSTTFDIASDYKVDSRASGRYLSYKFSLGASDYKDFELSGFDLDVTTTGRV